MREGWKCENPTHLYNSYVHWQKLLELLEIKLRRRPVQLWGFIIGYTDRAYRLDPATFFHDAAAKEPSQSRRGCTVSAAATASAGRVSARAACTANTVRFCDCGGHSGDGMDHAGRGAGCAVFWREDLGGASSLSP